MAKSLEDTSFYRYSRFIARNEVGGDPTRIYTSVPSFHKENKYRLERQPFNMLASATHDHKRGEDVRARLNVLSEVPERFAGVVRRLRDLSGFFKTTVDGKHYPSNSDEYFFYQTVLGSWPPDLSPPDWTGIEEFTKRLSSYMLKAIREAKTHTSWTAVNEEYETAMSRFIAGVLNPGRSQVVLRELYGFVSEIERPGAVNALAQLVLKLTSPGVPDIYQGCDRWDFSLVDPDNRRSVDFERRAEAMADLKNPDLEELTREWRDGRIKQYVTSQILALRRRAPDLFAVGSYEPLSVTPPAAEHVVAFLRRHEERAMVVCVPRLSASKLGAEQSLSLSGYEESSVRLPEELGRTGTFRELLSGTEYTPHPAEDGLVELPVGPLLCLLPVAVLESGAR
jgi:(1->4)-alpha-D-glucan 1-alpha-D-glucosylmutase